MTAPTVPGRTLIVDLDGTLADVRGVRHYVTGEKRNFEAFHSYASTLAPINPAVKSVVQTFWNVGWYILIFSGRHEKWRHNTEMWLAKHRVRYDGLYMRDDDDYRKDVVLKREMYQQIADPDLFDIRLAIDDNPSIVALWRSLDIPTLVVPGWDDDLEEELSV